ncbi:unnamed protein product [Trifolium pratense]|uniref:Uncharacterized protein n=1 Tax=Trifolium pratense TaxID=57577 RepID=A0ACB0LFR3_TRIPR|nr:unnamed protein product [Trifolium pratense]
MYAAVIFVGINNCQTVQPIVAIERTVFYRERAAGMYAPLPYALAQVLIEVPFVLFQTLYYSLLVDAMVGFPRKVEKFFWFVFVSFFSFLYFTYYGMMAVSITPNHQVASIFAAAFYGIFNLFSGFVIPRPVEFNELEGGSMLTTTIAWDNALSWSWENAMSALQETLYKVSSSIVKFPKQAPPALILSSHNIPTYH